MVEQLSTFPSSSSSSSSLPPPPPPPLPPPILPPIGDLKMTHIFDLKPFLKNINCKFIVLRKVEEPKPAKDGGIVYSFQVADDSGAAVANFWNEIGAAIKIGDIILIAGGFVTMFKNSIRVACKLGTVIRIGRFKMNFNDNIDVSKAIWLPNPNNPQELVKQVESSIPSSPKRGKRRTIPS